MLSSSVPNNLILPAHGMSRYSVSGVIKNIIWNASTFGFVKVSYREQSYAWSHSTIKHLYSGKQKSWAKKTFLLYIQNKIAKFT